VDSEPKYDGITKRWAAVVSTDIGDLKNFQDMLTSGNTCIILSQLFACASSSSTPDQAHLATPDHRSG
jgi:hypothetical protein